MARQALSQTLIIPSLLSGKSTRCGARLLTSSYSTLSEEYQAAAADTVRRLEDAIHRIIVKRSAPDWLPFVPGASYWVPPKPANYGIADLVHKLANAPSEEEVMSLTTSRGWPSSAFYLNGSRGGGIYRGK